MADATDGGSDWEVVSLTASTYAAAPGPIPIDAAAKKTESPLLLLPNPPAPPAHLFMSQHFNLPAKEALFGTHLENNKGGQELESHPAVPEPDGHLNMPRPESERDDLQVEGGGGDQVQQTTTVIPSLADATAGSDATADGSATLPAPAPAATVPVAGGVGGQAWWEKTFSFPRQDGNGNGTQPLAFRFAFVAGKLQLQEDNLTPEFGVNSHNQNIGCAVTEPLGEVKGSMLGGGSPVAQQG